MKIASIILFSLIFVIHLYGSYVESKKIRNLTKPLLVPFIIVIYCLYTQNIKATLIAALIFSWIGDVLLMKKGMKFFVLGGAGFFIAHILLVISFGFKNFIFSYFIVPFLIYLTIAGVVIYKLRKDIRKPLLNAMALYLFINGIMNCFSFLNLLAKPNLYGILGFSGAILFFVSDCLLYFVRFRKNIKPRNHMLVMLAYVLGLLFISLSMLH